MEKLGTTVLLTPAILENVASGSLFKMAAKKKKHRKEKKVLVFDENSRRYLEYWLSDPDY